MSRILLVFLMSTCPSLCEEAWARAAGRRGGIRNVKIRGFDATEKGWPGSRGRSEQAAQA